MRDGKSVVGKRYAANENGSRGAANGSILPPLRQIPFRLPHRSRAVIEHRQRQPVAMGDEGAVLGRADVDLAVAEPVWCQHWIGPNEM